MWAPPHLSRDLHSPSSSLPRPHTQEDQDDDDAPGTGPAHHDTGTGITNDAWCPPDGWIEAPPQGAIVRDVFIPSKAPLSDTWHADGRVPSHRRYGPHEALDMAKQASGGRSVELVIDLTNSSRYYDPAVFDARGASYDGPSTAEAGLRGAASRVRDAPYSDRGAPLTGGAAAAGGSAAYWLGGASPRSSRRRS